jgi:phosphatidylglycerophosphatase A
MRERLIKFLATGFGVGYLPVAPGTAGSVVGLGFWWALNQEHHLWLRAVLWCWPSALPFGVPGEASDIMHHPDPPSVVIDEIVAMPLALIGLGTRLVAGRRGVRNVPALRHMEAVARSRRAGFLGWDRHRPG